MTKSLPSLEGLKQVLLERNDNFGNFFKMLSGRIESVKRESLKEPNLVWKKYSKENFERKFWS